VNSIEASPAGETPFTAADGARLVITRRASSTATSPTTSSTSFATRDQYFAAGEAIDGPPLTRALWMKGLPGENTETYVEHSPIFYTKNFQTPTMVTTGQQDLLTPIAESEELYFALKARRVPAVLERIPG